MLDALFVTEPTPIEHRALSIAFNDFMEEKSKKNGNKKGRNFEQDQLKELISTYETIFSKNPAIHSLAKQSKKGGDVYKIIINEDDHSHLRVTRELSEYAQSSRKSLSKIKARFMIFCLEIEGFYKRPKDVDRNQLHRAIMGNCFFLTDDEQKNNLLVDDLEKENHSPGYFSLKDMESLCGTYQVFRLSFNNSFEGNIATYTLTVSQDLENPRILQYSTFNKYHQYQPSSADKSQLRIRRSKGHLYNYQDQILFLGGVSYTHMDFEGEEKKANYPEIFLMHRHSGDSKNCRGIILAHFPYLSLPVATSIYICKLPKDVGIKVSNLESKMLDNENSVLTIEEEGITARHYGNIDPSNEGVNIDRLFLKNGIHCHGSNSKAEESEFRSTIKKNVKELFKEVERVEKYVTNSIELKYTKMLTP
jgi:hypothetical protein